VAVRLTYDSESLKQWAGQRSGPVAVYEKDRPRSGWAEILLLAERLASAPSLLPADAAERAVVFGFSHEICGEEGLGWSRRLHLIHAGLHNAGGFPEPVAKYLSKKYGYSPQAAAAAGQRVAQLLGMLAARLKAQLEAGSRYYVGQSLTAVDVYSAAFHGPVQPAAVRAMRDGSQHEGGLPDARYRDRRSAGPCPVPASRHDVRSAPGTATGALNGI